MHSQTKTLAASHSRDAVSVESTLCTYSSQVELIATILGHRVDRSTILPWYQSTQMKRGKRVYLTRLFANEVAKSADMDALQFIAQPREGGCRFYKGANTYLQSNITAAVLLLPTRSCQRA